MHSTTRTIKEAMYIRVNDPSLNWNTGVICGKYNFVEYKIFLRCDETMLFWHGKKVVCDQKYFLLYTIYKELVIYSRY